MCLPRLKGLLSWATKRMVAVFSIAVLWGGQFMAQSSTPISNTDLSKETENPVSRQITLPLRYEADFLDGAYKDTKHLKSIRRWCHSG
jgi:hypothetical protein